MRKSVRNAVLAGAAAIAIMGTALAASNDNRVMTVNLPDGSLARIAYKGDVAPTVRIEQPLHFGPVRFLDPFDDAPFTATEQLFADMNRRAATMLSEVNALEHMPLQQAGARDWAGFGKLPGETISYRFVSSGDGSHVCSRAWRLTSQGPNLQPKLVSSSSGDCGADGKGITPAAGAGGPTAPAITSMSAVPKT